MSLTKALISRSAIQVSATRRPQRRIGTGDYSIKVPSTTVGNTISGDMLGLIYGAGFKASIVPDTIVNPAIALDLRITRSHYNFNRITPGGTPGINSGFSSRSS